MADTTLTISENLAKVIARGGAIELNAIGAYFALFNVPTGSSACSFSGTTDQITLGTAQDWITKTKVRFTQVGFSPPSLSPLTTNTDYWLIRDSSTLFKVAASLADAEAGTFIQLPTISSGEYSVAAKAPSGADAISDLTPFEVSHAVYTARYAAPNGGSLEAVTASGGVARQPILVTQINNTDPATLTFNCVAIIDGSGTIGDTTGTLIDADLLQTFNGFAFTPAPVSVAQGEIRDITYNLTTNYTA